MDAVIRICGAALCAASIGILLKQVRPEFAALTSTAASLVILTYAVVTLSPAAEFMRDLLSDYSEYGECFTVMIKALGITAVSSMSADLCRDLGESSLASKVEFAAKAEIMLLSLPLVERILRLCTELLAL